MRARASTLTTADMDDPVHTTNQNLIQFGSLRVDSPHLNQACKDLFISASIMYKQDPMDFDTTTNETFRLFRNWLWDEATDICNNDTKYSMELFMPLFECKPHGDLSIMGSNADFVAVAQKTLNSHMRSTEIVEKKSTAGWERYKSTEAAYLAAVAKQSSLDPLFDEPLTDGEKKLLATFKPSDPSQMSGGYEEHFANQNAVDYAFLIVRMLSHVVNEDASLEENQTTADNLFRFLGAKATTSEAKFKTLLNSMTTIKLAHDTDYKASINTMMSPPHFKTGTNKKDDKLLSNKYLSFKRLQRCISIWGSGKTHWAILRSPNITNLSARLKELQEIEETLDSRDMISHAICWYYVIGRLDLLNPYTDRWDLSGEKCLGKMLGADHRDPKENPNATPFKKPINGVRFDEDVLWPPESSTDEGE